MFKEVHEAYQILNNESSRRQYDEENGKLNLLFFIFFVLFCIIAHNYALKKIQIILLKGIRNIYSWQKLKMGFGDAQSFYEGFEKVDSEEIKKKIDLDKEFYSYFEANYFKNTDFIYNPDKMNDEFDVTPLLLRKKEELKQKKRTHKIYYPFSNKAYYDSVPEQEKQNLKHEENKKDKKIIDETAQKINLTTEQNNKKYVSYDEETKINEQIEKENFAKFHNTIPEYSDTQVFELKNKEKIIIGFGFVIVLTLIGFFQGIIESNKNKQEIQRARINNYGSGITAKSTPLSLF